jgi:hypothetical protein
MVALLFLFAFQKDAAFTHLSCLPSAWWSLAKHSPFYLFFPSFATPVQKNDVHPMNMVARFLLVSTLALAATLVVYELLGSGSFEDAGSFQVVAMEEEAQANFMHHQ